MHLCSQTPVISLCSLCADVCVWFDVRLCFCIHTWEHTIFFTRCKKMCVCVFLCVKSHLAQLPQQDGDARQSLGSPLVVTVTEHETHQLRISGTHCLLKNCRTERG